MVTVLNMIISISRQKAITLFLLSHDLLLIKYCNLIGLSYKRFPSRFPASSQEKVVLNFILSCGKKDNGIFFWHDKLILFSRSRSCSCCKKDWWKPTVRSEASQFDEIRQMLNDLYHIMSLINRTNKINRTLDSFLF